MNCLQDLKIAIIGLGYVGLPLAVAFGKQRSVLGFDINPKRLAELQAGCDVTRETEPEELQAASHLRFSSHANDLLGCNLYIITVPTPINEHKQPDLTPLIKASETVGKVLKPGDIVIYESTVYPGCTEEDCVPVLEKFSGLKYISHGSPRSARDDGNSARDDGNSARDDGNSARDDGNSARDDGNSARGDGNSARGDGNSARGDGNSARGDGNSARGDGNSARGDGNSARGDGNSARDDGNSARGDGNSAHGDGNSARDDGNSARDDGNSARDDEALGFYCGYSPERINPGDKEHRVTSIKKVTSGSTPAVADLVDALYRQIITAGTFKATSIKVAEAAKVIENTQRDLNIALINELALIFNKMQIDTEEVLQAAGSKWNFLPFRPGLVGGHCIGVDPYYLTHKAEAIGYHPQIILAGRRLNDSMGAYVVTQLVKAMTKRRQQVDGARVLIMGLSFKENCPDLRNTRVVDIVKELADYQVQTDVYDPWVSPAEAEQAYGITPVQQPELGAYDAIIIAVAHHQFKSMGGAAIRALGKPQHVLYDLKYLLPASGSDLRL